MVEDPFSSLVNCHHLRLKYTAIVLQTKGNVQVLCPRVDTPFNHIIEFRVVGMYIQILFRIRKWKSLSNQYQQYDVYSGHYIDP